MIQNENASVKIERIITALNNIFPSLTLFPEEVTLLYRPGLSKLSPAAIFDFLSELIIQIPEAEIRTKIPMLISELFNLLEPEAWHPALNRITDLITATETLSTRQLLNDILQSLVLV